MLQLRYHCVGIGGRDDVVDVDVHEEDDDGDNSVEEEKEDRSSMYLLAMRIALLHQPLVLLSLLLSLPPSREDCGMCLTWHCRYRR